MSYRHVKVRYKPIQISSLNLEKGLDMGELEQFLLLCQDLINQKIDSGRKGKKFSNGQKMSYKKAQGVLWELGSYFALKGCFSFGTCSTCSRFGNACSTSGVIGYCKGQEKHAFDACSEHSDSGGGFGLETNTQEMEV